MAMKSTTKHKLNKRLMRVIALAMMCIMGVSSAVTVAALTKEITVVDGDNQIAVSTMNDDTNRVLQLAGVLLGDGDQVTRDDKTGTITVLRAFSVLVKADGEEHTVTLNQGTVEDALLACGVTLGGNDKVIPGKTAELTPDMTITVERYRTITVTVDGNTNTYLAPEGTLEEALAYIGLTLGQDDVVTPGRDEKTTEGLEVKVDRVEYRDVTITEEIPFTTTTQETRDLYQGEKKISVQGKTGERTVVTKEKLVNGQVAETEVVSNEVTKEPVSQVVLVGTKQKPAPKPTGVASVGGDGTLIDHNGKRVAYKSVLTGTCTAYSAAEGSMTSTGRPAAVGYVAVNPKVIPYGTRLYICSPDGSLVYGYAIAADTGGALMSGRVLVDVFYNTVAECNNFGRRTMSVYVLA